MQMREVNVRFSMASGLIRWLVLLPLSGAVASLASDAQADTADPLARTPLGIVKTLKNIAERETGNAGSARLGTQALQPAIAPSNDDFANAQPLTGSSGTVSGSNVDATVEPGEPAHAAGAGGFSSIWYIITPASNGVLTVDTFGSDFDTVLAAYTGNAVNALTEVASNDDSGDGLQSLIGFPVSAGITYAIAVDGFFGDQGNVVLNFALQAPAPNDDFANAIALQGTQGSAQGNNIGATAEVGEPVHAGVAGISSVWYTFTAPQTGLLFLDTFGSSFDTVLAVYTGNSVDMLTEVTSNDDAGLTTFQSQVIFLAQQGVTYQVAVDGFAGEQGVFTLNFQQTDELPPANDDFDDAVALTGQAGVISDDNFGATSQAGEPLHALFGGGSSVWYQIRTQSDRVVTLDTFGSDLDTQIAVYTGGSVDNLSLVAASDIAGAVLQSQVAFLAMAGTTYRIAVDAFDVAQGSFDLRFERAGDLPPANDDFADAEVLPGQSGSVTGDNRGATKQAFESLGFNFPGDGFPGDPSIAVFPGEIVHGGTRSVWYRFEPSRDGVTFVDTFGSDFDTVLFVYEGETSDDLRFVAFNDDASERQSSLAFLAEAGNVYHISVDGFPNPPLNIDSSDVDVDGGDQGDIRLSFRRTNRLTPPNDDFEDAITLVGDSGIVSGFNIGATAQNLEPAPPSLFFFPDGQSSVWWEWQAPFSGPVSFTTARSQFDTVLTVWQGNSLGNLQEVATNDQAQLVDGSFIDQSLVTFEAEEGQVYRIEVDGFRFFDTDPTTEGSISLAFAPGELQLKAGADRLAEAKQEIDRPGK